LYFIKEEISRIHRTRHTIRRAGGEGTLVNNYSFSWLTDSEGLLEKWNVASNISANNARAIIPTMCQPLKIRFIPEATIPIMLAIFTFRFIILS